MPASFGRTRAASSAENPSGQVPSFASTASPRTANAFTTSGEGNGGESRPTGQVTLRAVDDVGDGEGVGEVIELLAAVRDQFTGQDRQLLDQLVRSANSPNALPGE